jgi:uncharacterized Zn-binding protein involved in type VI secretion
LFTLDTRRLKVGVEQNDGSTKATTKESVIFAGENSNRPWILVGDKTSKGGVVFLGSPVCTVNGKAMARVGDRATCKCIHCKSRGYTIITSGSGIFTANNIPVARDGDYTDCGAVLISTEGEAFDEAMRIASAFETGHLPNTEAFDIHFFVKDERTGKPRSHLPYRLTLPNGDEVSGMTDANGLTQKISANSALTARLQAPYYGDSTSTLDTEDGYSACCS